MISNEHDQIIKNPDYTKKEIEEIIKMVRLELYNSGLFCGARAIKKNSGYTAMRLLKEHVDKSVERIFETGSTASTFNRVIWDPVRP